MAVYGQIFCWGNLLNDKNGELKTKKRHGCTDKMKLDYAASLWAFYTILPAGCSGNKFKKAR